MEVTGINQDRDITVIYEMEITDLKGEMDAIADKPKEVDIEDKTQVPFTSNSVNFWQNLPDVPFNVLMTMQSTTQLRILIQVSSSLKKRIKENILDNPVNKKFLRARIERALGPGMFPSNEEIINAMWLSKIELSLIFDVTIFFAFSTHRHPRQRSCHDPFRPGRNEGIDIASMSGINHLSCSSCSP